MTIAQGILDRKTIMLSHFYEESKSTKFFFNQLFSIRDILSKYPVFSSRLIQWKQTDGIVLLTHNDIKKTLISACVGMYCGGTPHAAGTIRLMKADPSCILSECELSTFASGEKDRSPALFFCLNRF